MSRKNEIHKHHNTIVELSRKITEQVVNEVDIKDKKAIVALTKSIEKEADTLLDLVNAILEERDFGDFGPTE